MFLELDVSSLVMDKGRRSASEEQNYPPPREDGDLEEERSETSDDFVLPPFGEPHHPLLSDEINFDEIDFVLPPFIVDDDDVVQPRLLQRHTSVAPRLAAEERSIRRGRDEEPSAEVFERSFLSAYGTRGQAGPSSSGDTSPRSSSAESSSDQDRGDVFADRPTGRGSQPTTSVMSLGYI